MIKRSAFSILNRLADTTRAAYDDDRRHHPERFIAEPDGLAPTHLFVQNVARLLGCNMDHVRRIPRNLLPASKIGARLIYARADVEAYISTQRDRGSSRYVANRAPELSGAVPARPKEVQLVAPFDPVAEVRKALKK